MKFRRWVIKSGLSQPEVAEVLRVPQSTVNRTMGGQSPQAHTCAIIIRATNGEVTLEDLVGEEWKTTLAHMSGRLVSAATAKRARQALEETQVAVRTPRKRARKKATHSERRATG